MLKPMYLWIILILNLILVIVDTLGILKMLTFKNLDWNVDWMYECSLVIILFLVQTAYVYILTKFEITDYTLRTVVTFEGYVEVHGIGENEEEIFKFRIDPEKLNQQQILPGMYKKYFPVDTPGNPHEKEVRR